MGAYVLGEQHDDKNTRRRAGGLCALWESLLQESVEHHQNLSGCLPRYNASRVLDDVILVLLRTLGLIYVLVTDPNHCQMPFL